MGNQSGFFLMCSTPRSAGSLGRGARETVEAGSLNFYLKAEGTAPRPLRHHRSHRRCEEQTVRADRFNSELAKGHTGHQTQPVWQVAGGRKPAFPLTLRDVDGFLLIPTPTPTAR